MAFLAKIVGKVSTILRANIRPCNEGVTNQDFWQCDWQVFSEHRILISCVNMYVDGVTCELHCSVKERKYYNSVSIFRALLRS